MKQTITIISNLILLLAVTAALILFVPRALGLENYAVLSSSMEPTLPVGSVIYTRPVALIEDIKEGDIISFQAASVLVAHRVVTVDRDAGTLITKGDANKVIDAAPIDFRDVTGKVSRYIPYLGYILVFLDTSAGRITLCVSTALLLILIQILNRLETKEYSLSDAPDSQRNIPTSSK